MEVHFQDNPGRAPGYLYPAIDPTLFFGPPGNKPAMGLFSVVGDRVGNVPIADVILTAEGAGRAKEIKDEILADCRASLASHKVPAVIRFVEALDVTPAGKLARSDA